MLKLFGGWLNEGQLWHTGPLCITGLCLGFLAQHLGRWLSALPIITNAFFFSTLLFPDLCTGRLIFMACITQTPLSSGFGLGLANKGITPADRRAEGRRGHGPSSLFFSSLFWPCFSGNNFSLWQAATPPYLQFLLDPDNTAYSLYSFTLQSGNSFLLLIVSAYVNIPFFYEMTLSTPLYVVSQLSKALFIYTFWGISISLSISVSAKPFYLLRDVI